MNGLKQATEYATDKELSEVDRLAEAFESWPLTLQEKLTNPGLFLRRQELSYLIAKYEIFKRIEQVKGSIFYFGVYHGSGFMAFANLSAALEPFNYNRKIIGFDTFAGYPELTEADTTPNNPSRTLAEGGYHSDSQGFLEALIEIYDQNRPLNHVPKTELVKGDVCQTLSEYLTNNPQSLASLIVLTMNLYEPTKVAISLLWPRMPRGGVVLIRTLNEACYPGATRAVLEVLGDGIAINAFPFAPNMAYIVKD